VQRFPKADEVAALALFRQGLLDDRRGEWASAKRVFESIPRLYPGSQAAAEAPMAVIDHYWREGFRTAARNYLSRASDTYEELLERDPAGKWAVLIRFKVHQVARLGRDSTGMYAVTEEMLRRHLRHPYTGQVVLGTARASAEFGNPARGAGYLSQYLEDFPQSPLADQMRQDLRRLQP
jgi:outer membrane protein assembly factor BamD (BamD/ComL family)